MRISVLIALSLLLPTPLYAQTSSDPIEFNQEEYNRQVTKEMEEMSQALQAMSTFMVKSMNNMTQAINQSIPGLTKSMGELDKSMGPIIKAAQENQKLGNEMDKRHPPATEDKPAAAPSADIIVTEELLEISQPEQPYAPEVNTVYKPKKIQLFPAPQPNY